MCCVLRNVKYFITLILFFSELSDWQTYGAEESTILNPLHKASRQDLAISIQKPGQFVGGEYGHMLGEGLDELALRAGPTKPPPDVTKSSKKNTTKWSTSPPHNCDYMARPCMSAYQTGKICARTIGYKYQTFENYCMMEFVNCRENYEVWQMVYVGACFDVPELVQHVDYAYHDDIFLDNFYVFDEAPLSEVHP